MNASGRFRKAQAAMEYLMTYGWAILIIAIVLAALFALGIFRLGQGTSCNANAGLLCQNPILNVSGLLSVNIGQGITSNMYNVQIACAASSKGSSNLPNPLTAFEFAQTNGGLVGGYLTYNSANSLTLSGGSVVNLKGITCYASGATPLNTISIGSPFTGYLWINYTSGAAAPSSSNPYLTLQLSTISVSAT